MRLALTLAGHDVESAPSRDAALDLLQAISSDVIVMDYLVPGLDAATFLSTARSRGFAGKVLLCTGLDGAEELSVDAVLPKPFEPDELTAAVESLLS
jgi:DNA-binding response OmpR family regulator